MTHKEKLSNPKIPEKSLVIIAVILAVVVVALFVYVYGSPSTQGEKQYSAEVIEIGGDCEDCFNVKQLADAIIQENNLNVKSRDTLDYNSQEAREMIEKYKIKAVPSLIILSKNIGELTINAEIFSINDKSAVFDKSVPYINLETENIEGVVNLIEIQPDNCIECTPLSSIKTQFERLGMKVGSYEMVSSSSDRGIELIEKNDLTFAPVLLISKDIKEYWWLFAQVENAIVEKEDYFVFKNPVAPYTDLVNGEVKGKVDVIYLENKSCEDCFNVTQLKGSFQSLGIYFDDEKHVDVSSGEGKNLLKKYDITAIPTVIFSKEIQDYETIGETLSQIGSFESDGKFVFRKLDSLNAKYQELT